MNRKVLESDYPFVISQSAEIFWTSQVEIAFLGDVLSRAWTEA
jgi:hypothetical protein